LKDTGFLANKKMEIERLRKQKIIVFDFNFEKGIETKMIKGIRIERMPFVFYIYNHFLRSFNKWKFFVRVFGIDKKQLKCCSKLIWDFILCNPVVERFTQYLKL
jgi:hypothetical protein